MYVTSLKCDFGAFDEDMVVFLTRWNLRALDNVPRFSFDVTYMAGVQIKIFGDVLLWVSCMVARYLFWHRFSEGINNGIPPFL